MDDLPEEEVLPLFSICQHNSSTITVNASLNGKSVVMEVDTGAAVSIMSQCQQRELFSLAALQESTVVLSAYTVDRVPVVGSLPVHMEYNGQEKDLSLIVVESNGPALMGRDWLRHLHLNWKMIAYHNHGIAELEKVLQPYAEVFADELRTVQDTTVSLAMKKSSQPKFFVLVWCHSPSKVPSKQKSIVWSKLVSWKKWRPADGLHRLSLCPRKMAHCNYVETTRSS